tara:strand:- start:2977 stop:3315 length:339 start_codon:yes stop_codon:yes gene_type:complete
MAITYKWTINALDAKISHDSKDNVINTIHWGYSGSEGEAPNILLASSIGTHSLEYDKDNFTEYASLKESDVIGWLEAALDVDAMKAGLDAQIALQKAPVDKTFHSPFIESVE